MPRVPAAGPWVVISIFYFSAFHRQQSLAGFGAGTGFYVFIFAFFIFIFLVSNVIIMVCCRRHRRRHHHIIISIIIKFIPTQPTFNKTMRQPQITSNNLDKPYPNQRPTLTKPYNHQTGQ